MKMKRQVRGMAAALLFGLMTAGTVFAEESGDVTFVQGTTVNGLGVSGMTVEEADAHVREFYSGNYELVLKEKGGVKETIRGSDIGFAVGLPEGFLQGILDEQNASGRVSGPDVNSKYRVDMANTFDEQALTGKINGLNCVSGNVTETADAHVTAYREGQAFEIVPEVVGNNVNYETLTALIRAAVAAGMEELDLAAAGCYYVPQVTADSQELKDLCDTMNRCREMTVTYTFGENVSDGAAEEAAEGTQPVTEVLDAAVICSWLTGTQDGQIQVDREQAAAWVAALAGKYDTAGTARTFHTADGRDVSVSGGTYGWKINQTAETDALIEVIRTGQSQSREPVYASAAASRTVPEWGNTYVEVDLTNQHVYMTQDGAIIWDAPCVTGDASKNRETPAGLYSLTYKQRDRVLRGAKRADGSYEYESPVSCWMPFNGGIGLHDASWRGSFGGSIYKTDGSHGCVNLPSSKAASLYELVFSGVPVICYH